MSTPKAKRDKDEDGGSRGTTPKGAKEDPQEAATEVKAERGKKSSGNKDKEAGESTEKHSKSSKKGEHGESHADADKPSKGDKDEHHDDGAKKPKSKRKSKEYPVTDSEEEDEKEPVAVKKPHHKKASSGSDSEHAVSPKHAASPPVKAATYPLEGSDKDNSKREHSASRSTSKKNIPSKDTDFDDTSTSSQVENETRSRHVDTVEDLLDADTSDEDSDEEDAKLFPRTCASFFFEISSLRALHPNVKFFTLTTKQYCIPYMFCYFQSILNALMPIFFSRQLLGAQQLTGPATAHRRYFPWALFSGSSKHIFDHLFET